MFLDIHRHSKTKGSADIVLRNLFHNEADEIEDLEFCSVGLHPWHVKENSLQHNLDMVNYASDNSKVIAIGETGLDKAIDTNIKIQAKAFLAQIEIAKKQNKPIIIHCVRAYNELQTIRENSKHNNSWIIHCYNASIQTGLNLIHKGCYLSFGHMLFNQTSKAYNTFQEIPIRNVFLETDDADVSITKVYEKAAELKNISLLEMQRQIQLNFYNCFGIKI